MPRPPNAGDLISLQEAAAAGYRSVSALRKDARAGQIQVIQKSPRVILTIYEWLNRLPV